MARKELSDFNGDYQAFADYLESAECANDEGYDIVADENGNIYEPTDGDWTKGHGHINTNNGYNRFIFILIVNIQLEHFVRVLKVLCKIL